MLTKRVLVTGGLGFIGGEVVELLLAGDGVWAALEELLIVDRFSEAATVTDRASAMCDPRVRLECFDLADADRTRDCVRRFRPDLVLHLAAETHVDRSFGNALAFTRSNVLGTQHLLEACVAEKVGRFVYMSTDEVYGSGETVVGEGGHDPSTAILVPTNPYSASKAAAEMLCCAYMRSFGLDCVIIRCNNVFGPLQHCEKVVPRFVLQALAGVPFSIHGDGSQRRSFMFVRDAAGAILLVAERAEPGDIYNVGAEEEISIRDLAARVQAAAGIAPLPGLRFERNRLFNDYRYPVRTEKLRALGWLPRHGGLDEGLRSTASRLAAISTRRFLPPEIHDAVHGSGHFDSAEEIALRPWGSGNPADAVALRAQHPSARRPTEEGDRPRRVLLFGATGWIGGKLMEIQRQDLTWIPATSRLEDTAAVWEELSRVAPDRVVLAAGITGRPNVDWCEENAERTFRVNVEGTVMLARMCARLGLPLATFATGCIYTSHPGEAPKRETDPANFFGSLYSRTKIQAEQMLASLPGALIFRLRMPIDDDLQHPRNLVAKLRNYRTLVDIPNSVSVLGDLLPPAVEMILAGRESGIYNFTNPGAVTPAEIRRMDDAARGVASDWEVVTSAELLVSGGHVRAGRSNCVLDASKFVAKAAEYGYTVPDAVSSLRAVFACARK